MHRVIVITCFVEIKRTCGEADISASPGRGVKCVIDGGKRQPGWTCQGRGEAEAAKTHCVP